MNKYTIKPLKWRKTNNGFLLEAITKFIPDSGYAIEEGNGGLLWSFKLGDYEKWFPCETIEEGKELAEEHWQKTIKKCLNEVTE